MPSVTPRGAETRAVNFGLGKGRRRAALSLAPLIDVTFILLIFFMLVTQFSRLGPVNVTLDRAPDVVDQPTKNDGRGAQEDAVLHVEPDGSLRFRDQAVAGLDVLGAALDAYRRGFVPTDARTQPTLLIKPDGEVPLQLLVDVLVTVQMVPDLPLRLIIPEAEEAEE